MQGKPPGIKEMDEFVHYHRDAGCIPAFNDNYHRDLFIPKISLEYTQLLLQGFDLLQKLFVISLFCQIKPFKH